jgi:uncharacterized repeat protein (TIGR02543 family)
LGATIYYTVDKTEPTTASAKYTAPINVSASLTIKAIAVKAGMNNSTVFQAAYTISGPTHTVTFVGNGGNAVDSQEVAEGGHASRPVNPLRQDYVFGGWYTDMGTYTNLWNFENDFVNEDLALYAKWLTPYTVQFESNGGSEVMDQIVGQGQTATKPDNPTKANNGFGGWYTDDITFADPWDFDSDTITENTTLYAKWNFNQYTVTFHSNEGSAIDPVMVEYGSPVEMPDPAPHKTGCTFTGWYTDNNTFNNLWNFASTVTEDVDLYAKWNINVGCPEELEFRGGPGESVKSA